MKKIIIEIIVIVVVSAVAAFTYNALSSNPLPLVPKPKDEMAVKDDWLFGDNYSTKKEDLNYSVTYEQMRKIAGSSEFVIIDARRPGQFEQSHIQGAINIYPHTQNQEIYFEKLATLPQGKPIVCYCDGGTCDLSHIVAKELISLGYERVFVYQGGWAEWSENQ